MWQKNWLLLAFDHSIRPTSATDYALLLAMPINHTFIGTRRGGGGVLVRPWPDHFLSAPWERDRLQ